MTPKCCEKCARREKDNCAYFKNCEAWRSWFKKQWEAIREKATDIREHNRAVAAGTSRLDSYKTEPAGITERSGKKGQK